MGFIGVLEHFRLKFGNKLQRNIPEEAVSYRIDYKYLMLNGKGSVSSLLKNLNNSFTQRKTFLCVLIQVRTELGERLKLTVL